MNEIVASLRQDGFVYAHLAQLALCD